MDKSDLFKLDIKEKIAIIRIRIADFKKRRELLDNKILEFETYIDGINSNTAK